MKEYIRNSIECLICSIFYVNQAGRSMNCFTAIFLEVSSFYIDSHHITKMDTPQNMKLFLCMQINNRMDQLIRDVYVYVGIHCMCDVIQYDGCQLGMYIVREMHADTKSVSQDGNIHIKRQLLLLTYTAAAGILFYQRFTNR